MENTSVLLCQLDQNLGVRVLARDVCRPSGVRLGNGVLVFASGLSPRLMFVSSSGLLSDVLMVGQEMIGAVLSPDNDAVLVGVGSVADVRVVRVWPRSAEVRRFLEGVGGVVVERAMQ